MLRMLCCFKTRPNQSHAEKEKQPHKVFCIPEIVEVIFGHIASSGDLESLKLLRLVCSCWKSCVFSVLKSHLSLMPTIEARNACIGYASRTRQPSGISHRPWKSIQSYSDHLKPSSGFPVSVLLKDWSSEVPKFLKSYSNQIVSLEICLNNETASFDHFPAELGGIELAALEHCTLNVSTYKSDETKRKQISNVICLWEKLVGNHKRPKTCRIILCFPSDEALTYLALHGVQWSYVKSLRCCKYILKELVATKSLKSLERLDILDNEGNTTTTILAEENISLETAVNLTELTICGLGVTVNRMNKLKQLTISVATISSLQPLSKILPNLRKLWIIDQASTPNNLQFIYNGGKFVNIIELDLHESWLSQWCNPAHLCDVFPNLEKLVWTSCDHVEKPVLNNNSIRAAPVIFAKMKFLTRLTLYVGKTTAREVFEQLTGISMEDIPEDEESWPNTCVGNTKSICNLKHLQAFTLSIPEGEEITLPAKPSRFLFTAAFHTMDTLNKLELWMVTFEDTSGVTSWMERGRYICPS